MSTVNQTVSSKLVCNPVVADRVRSSFAQIANDSRLDSVVVEVPSDVYGMREGTHKLTELFKALISDTDQEFTTSVTSSRLGDIHTSNLEVLDRCQELLFAMSKTPWLDGAKIEITADDSSALIEGSYELLSVIIKLAILTKNAFNKKMGEPLFDFEAMSSVLS